MRFFLILIGLAVFQLAWGQYQSFGLGTYLLAGPAAVKQQAQLKLRTNAELWAKDLQGNKVKLTPEQVASFRIGSRKFVAAGGFDQGAGLSSTRVDRAFVEQLDSGQVVLLRYEYSSGGAPMGGVDQVSAGSGYNSVLYLLRNGLSLNPIPAGQNGGGRRFQEALQPYLRARPDLLKLLYDQRILAEDLPLLVRALNTGQPMPPTPSYLNRD